MGYQGPDPAVFGEGTAPRGSEQLGYTIVHWPEREIRAAIIENVRQESSSKWRDKSVTLMVDL